MSIYIRKSDSMRRYKVRYFIFPGGEVNVQIPELAEADHFTIEAQVASSNDFMAVLLTADAIRQSEGNVKISLFIPYFPYARQDRACNIGEALSVSVIAKMINAMDFHEVIIVDPHSDITPALINNCIVWDQTVILDMFSDYKEKFNIYHKLTNYGITLVSPDAGANKKTYNVAKHYGGLKVVQADKIRNTETGKITGTRVNYTGSMKGEDLLIVDDICDGGMTFIKLAEKLKEFEPNSINLYVTHGIFSKGYRPIFEAGIDGIFTTDSFDQIYETQGLKVTSIL